MIPALLALAAPAFADVSISPYMEKIPGYQAHLQEQITGLGGRARLGPFPKALLDEYVLKSYSQWSVKASDSKAGAQSPVVDLEVYESLDGPGAYGLFSIWEQLEDRRLTQTLDVPIEHRRSSADLIFWRRNYFLHLRANGTDAEGMARLLRALLDAIPPANDLPAAVARLPEEGLKPLSVQYYPGKNGLGLARQFPSQLMPLVGLKDHIEIASARYDPGDVSVFLVMYPTAALAKDYAARIREGFPQASEQGVYFKRSGPMIAVCVGSQANADQVLGRVNYRAQVKWIEDKPEPNSTVVFLGIVLRALVGTAAFLLVTFVLGVGAGYLRYQFLRRYPHLAKKTGMIRLDLEERASDRMSSER